MLLVFHIISAVDQDIINVDNNAYIEEGFQDVLDQSLECCWSVGESKGHDFVLIVTISSAESGFLNVILMDLDLVISPTQIDFGEDRGSL